jgi:hypothetical protein
MGMTQRNPAMVALFYLLPLAGAVGAIALLAGYFPEGLFARFRTRPA